MDWKALTDKKQVYIWGAWEVGYFLQQSLEKQGISVTAYLDGKKSGGSFHEKTVLRTDNLPVMASDPLVFVFVACVDHPGIRKLLHEAGFIEGMNMLYSGVTFQIVTPSYHYADAYGNEMITKTILPGFSVGMCGRIEVGSNVQFGENVRLIAWGGAKLIIGDGVKIGDNTLIEVRDCGSITFGNHCTIEENTICRAVHNGMIQFGENVLFAKGSDFYATDSEIVIGDGVSINQNVNARFFNGSKLVCGNNCTISYYTKLRGENGHTIIDLEKKCIHPNRKDVVIANHVWIGMGSTLIGGTVLAKDSIVGAESLVTKAFPENSLIAGNPAKVIKEHVTWDMRPDISYEDWDG